ncbi:MAG: Uncharacterised protein [Flavobacterium sp. SCGC AAA160-P02]|nr:MAG: Uncharacterised protein [Flavobacterium sp. SCGC AAA160-P02]
MPINQKLASKGFKNLLVLLLLLIFSPLLLTISFKAFKLYKEGFLLYLSIASIILSVGLIFFTLFFAFKTFKTLLDALFYEKSS